MSEDKLPELKPNPVGMIAADWRTVFSHEQCIFLGAMIAQINDAFRDNVTHVRALTERMEKVEQFAENINAGLVGVRDGGNMLLRRITTLDKAIADRLASVEERLAKLDCAPKGSGCAYVESTPDQPAPTKKCAKCGADIAGLPAYVEMKEICWPCYRAWEVSQIAHKCLSCAKEIPICDGQPTFGIDLDGRLRGAEADKVVDCKEWKSKKPAPTGEAWLRVKVKETLDDGRVSIELPERPYNFILDKGLVMSIDPADLVREPPTLSEADETWRNQAILNAQEGEQFKVRAEAAEARLREAMQQAKVWRSKVFSGRYMTDSTLYMLDAWLARYGGGEKEGK